MFNVSPQGPGFFIFFQDITGVAPRKGFVVHEARKDNIMELLSMILMTGILDEC